MNAITQSLLNMNAQMSAMTAFGNFAGQNLDPMMLAHLAMAGGGWGGLNQMAWGHNALRDMFMGHIRPPFAELRGGLEIKQQVLDKQIKAYGGLVNKEKNPLKKKVMQKSLSQLKQAKNEVDMGLRSNDPAKQRDAIFRARNKEVQSMQTRRSTVGARGKLDIDMHIRAYRMANLQLATQYAFI